MTNLFDRWVVAFIMTLALEIPVILLAAQDARWRRWVAAGLLGNTITHPLLCLVLLPWCWRHACTTTGSLAGELAVVGVEWGVYACICGGWRRALKVSIAANVYSVLVGAWINQFIVAENVRAALKWAGGGGL